MLSGAGAPCHFCDDSQVCKHNIQKGFGMYKLYAFFDLEQLNSETLERCMQYLPEERRAKALRYRREIDRKLSVASYLLLIYALHREFQLSAPTIAYTQKGKPYLQDYPDLHFNISHCPRGCVCAVSDQPIGVDIQDIRPFSQNVANYCCSAGELLLLKQSAEPAACFAQMWSMKESYLKMTGEGIGRSLTTIDTTGPYRAIHTSYTNNCYLAVSCASFFHKEIGST